MKKTGNRLVAVLLLIFALSAFAWAAETAEPQVVPQPDFEITVSHVNPEYAALGVKFEKPAADGMTFAETTVNSLEEAAAYLREQMENRVTEVKIVVKNHTYVDNAGLSADWKTVLNGAFEHTGVSTQGDYIKRHYGQSAGKIGHDGISTATFTYTITYDTTLEQENVVGDRIEELFAQWDEELDFYDLSDYQQVKIIFDYICENVEYDYKNLNDSSYMLKFSAYAALIDGTAVCQGYANLFYRMALELEIDSRIVVGWSKGSSTKIPDHGWNIVKLGDYYYYLDATWGDGTTFINYDWFLIGSENFGHRSDTVGEANFVGTEKYPIDTADYVPPAEIEVLASGKCGDNLTWSLTADYTLTITGEGEMYDYYLGQQPWADYSWEILKVVIGDGVTRIGDNAFGGTYEALAEVELPGTLVSIGEYAFGGCGVLTAIELPSTLTTIGVEAFAGVGLTSVVLGNNVTSIGRGAFGACPALQSVTLPANLTTIENALFAGCRALESITIPASVTSIGFGAFEGCVLLEKVTIPAGVTSIGGYAFARCEALKNIDIPSGVTKICDSTFSDCIALESITIPASVTKIEWYAFFGCSALATVNYTGTEEQWKAITIGDENAPLQEADIVYGFIQELLNGLNKDSDGVWRYYEDGKIATDFTGFVKHINGKYYFVDKGVVEKTTGLVLHVNGRWYYIKNGVKTDYTGFVKHSDGNYYYVKNGVKSETNGFLKHTNGKYYYVQGGMMMPTTGLVIHTNGKYYYIVKGVKQDDFTGLVKHEGEYYYVQKGMMRDDFTGLAKHTNKKFYYVENGVWTKVTALVPHSNGKLYYVVDGIFDKTYNGTAKTLDGVEYEVVNGIAQP